MKRILSILVAVVLLPSCASVPPLSLAYTGQAGGHDITAGYSTVDGVAISAQQVKPTGQK